MNVAWRGKRQPNQPLWITYVREGLVTLPTGSPWDTGWQLGAKAEPSSSYVNMDETPAAGAPNV